MENQRRNPNSKRSAIKAIARNAVRIGLAAADVFDAAAGLLDGQISADAFRATLRDQGANHGRDAEQHADAPGAATAAVEVDPGADEALATPRQQLLTACKRAAEVLHEYEIEEDTLQMLRAAVARAEGQTRRGDHGSVGEPPRSDSKQARLIAMLQRGASIDEMTREFGWLRHTCHGALAGLKKKRGLNIISNKPAGGVRIYRLNAPAEDNGHAV